MPAISPADIAALLSAGDAGNKPNNHYKQRLSPLRYRLRSQLLPIIRSETEPLARLQQTFRHPALDRYFAWLANLASHTFYVLMLPIPLWFGASAVSRDLIHVLGLGVYLLGYLKDYWCLPRPRSPPVHRITMSLYTAHEYGFPSSHSTNATAVSLVVWSAVCQYRAELGELRYHALLVLVAVYFASLILGRLYCGMHGFVDVLCGGAVGAALWAYRHFVGPHVDRWIFSTTTPALTAAGIVAVYAWMIHVHAEPVDDCPCFDDSVAFVGVLMGIDVGHLVAHATGYLAVRNSQHDPILIAYNYAQLGFVGLAARTALGVALIVAWKAVSKPAVFTLLPPLYKAVGLNLPRRNFIPTAFTDTTNRKIRSTLISNLGEEKPLFGLRDEVGPESEIDLYEILDYQHEKNAEVEAFPTLDQPKAGVFRARYDVEIVGRLIVYAGVALTGFWGFALVLEYFGLTAY